VTIGYYRTSSPVTALPMIMRWISDVPSKIVKILEILVPRMPSGTGRNPIWLRDYSSPHHGCARADG
jgi:hypothetical protein